MPPGFPRLYSHVTLTNPQISTGNPKSPKSVLETLDSQNSSFDLLSQNHDQNPRLPTQLILISQNHDQNKTIFEVQWKQAVQQVPAWGGEHQWRATVIKNLS